MLRVSSLFALACAVACGPGALPRPPRAQVRAEDYVPVPFPPGTPPLDFVPARPDDERAVWVDGTWTWDGARYRWTKGAWAVPPEGARRAPWVVVRRRSDGQLFFAQSTWVRD